MSQINERLPLLLHVCCGPCAEWPVMALRSEGFEPTAYFYNPNIHPRQEWQRRYENMQKMAQVHGVALLQDEDYREETWRAMGNLPKSVHCRYCYHLRLFEAARFAAEHGFAHLATALQVSPYQDQDLIRDTALAACRKYGVDFIDRPFSVAFREGQQMARDDELYRQKYCGCIYSLGETNEKYRRKVLQRYGLEDLTIPAREQDGQS